MPVSASLVQVAAGDTNVGSTPDRASQSFIDPKGNQQLPLKTSTLARRLSAISQAHQVAGIDFKRRHPAIQETWKGIRNTHGTAQKGKGLF